MELIIDFDNIEDSAKKEWLLHTLNLMGIGFHTTEKSQTIDEYNRDLESGNSEIENGEFITANELKKAAGKW